MLKSRAGLNLVHAPPVKATLDMPLRNHAIEATNLCYSFTGIQSVIHVIYATGKHTGQQQGMENTIRERHVIL